MLTRVEQRKALRERKWYLYEYYDDDPVEKWSEEHRKEFTEIQDALDKDWEKRYRRTQARKAKRLAAGKEWLDKKAESLYTISSRVAVEHLPGLADLVDLAELPDLPDLVEHRKPNNGC